MAWRPSTEGRLGAVPEYAHGVQELAGPGQREAGTAHATTVWWAGDRGDATYHYKLATRQCMLVRVQKNSKCLSASVLRGWRAPKRAHVRH